MRPEIQSREHSGNGDQERHHDDGGRSTTDQQADHEQQRQHDHEHDAHDDHDRNDGEGHEHGAMVPMMTTVKTLDRNAAMAKAIVQVDVPQIGATATIEIRFPAPENLGPGDLEADIYDRALMMLNPA